jgi:hypothetical protein
MDTHVRQFAVCTFLFSAAGFVLGLAMLWYYGGFSGLYYATDATGFGPAVTGLVMLNMLLAIPSAIAAWGLLQYRDWARNTMIMICALNVLNLPLGSLLGAYGLWVLMSEETEPLFQERLPHIRAAAKARQTAAEPKAEAGTQGVRADLKPRAD